MEANETTVAEPTVKTGMNIWLRLLKDVVIFRICALVFSFIGVMILQINGIDSHSSTYPGLILAMSCATTCICFLVIAVITPQSMWPVYLPKVTGIIWLSMLPGILSDNSTLGYVISSAMMAAVEAVIGYGLALVVRYAYLGFLSSSTKENANG